MTKKRKNQEVGIFILMLWYIIYEWFVLGFGFLSFEDEEAVDRCVSEHFVNLNGKQVSICYGKE